MANTRIDAALRAALMVSPSGSCDAEGRSIVFLDEMDAVIIRLGS
jgi:hypothetical protein